MNTASILITAICLQISAHAYETIPSTTNTTAYQNAVAQEELRLASQRLKQEMSTLADEYRGYHAAAPEVAKLQSVIDSLDHVSNLEMAQVVKALMTASHNDDPTSIRNDLVRVNASQKAIQVTLRSLADKLSQQADAATLQKRIEELAVRQSTNLHATSKLAASPPIPNISSETARMLAIEELSMRKTEQTTLENEIGSTTETLRKSANTADPTAAKPLAATLATAEAGQLEQHAKDASMSLEQAPGASSKHQHQVLDNLIQMANQLAESRNAEEQIRELADAISELSQKEQSLAAKTPRLDQRNQKQAQQGQQDVASRLDILSQRVANLNSQAATDTNHALEQAQHLAHQLADPNFVSDANHLVLTSDTQKGLAAQLAKISNTLQQQADALAAASHPSQLTESSISPEEQAIQDAMAELLNAKADNALAGRLNDQKQDYQQRLAKSREEIAAANQKVAQAGLEVAKNVQQALHDAEGHAALAADKKEPGHNLYHVNVNIDKALATLQEAANQLATAETKDQIPQDAQGAGMGITGSGSGSGPGHGKGAYSGGRATSDALREALSLLKQEKVAPEYQLMVNQYMTNLADDTPPDH